MPGGSGSFSMLENRNCMGQVVNDETRDGDRLVGVGNTAATSGASGALVPSSMSVIVDGGCDEVAAPVGAGAPCSSRSR
jgi:hypothetical protein